MRSLKKTAALMLGLALAFSVLPFSGVQAAGESTTETVYRVFSKDSGEHFFTSNEKERAYLVSQGWVDEGVAFNMPASSNTPVYRLFSAAAGEHLYTVNAAEKDYLSNAGWDYEGVAFYSDDKKTAPVWRQFNPAVAVGSHVYTGNAVEKNYLCGNAGWEYEGVAFNALSIGDAENNDDIMILVTSDVHCGIDKGFGYAGVYELKESLKAQGYDVLLVDNGDAIQGEPIGAITKGSAIIDIMNEMGYDVATPGNHEFDFGVDNFLSLTEQAKFPYISNNFSKRTEDTEGYESVLNVFELKEAGGKNIAFVGLTTPDTLTSTTPKYFQDDEGNFIYTFLPGKSRGEAAFYESLQNTVDLTRMNDADHVFVMGHIGVKDGSEPYRYVDIIPNISGIDAFLDGHSHDTAMVEVSDKDGKAVPRLGVGTKLSTIGYVKISGKDDKVTTGQYSWNNKKSLPELFKPDNAAARAVALEKSKLDSTLEKVVGHSDFDLTIYDPVEKSESGAPVRIVRKMETNLGDFCTDAYRARTGADIAFVNGGGVRTSIKVGDIKNSDIVSVHPFGNDLTVIKATGQQILDALELGVIDIPSETDGFLHVSGMSYTIDTSIKSTVTKDENGYFTGVAGDRRVKDVMVGDEPIDPEKFYTVASNAYILLNNGNGCTMFNGDEVVMTGVLLDSQALIDYLVEDLGGNVGEQYKDPYGSGRIIIK